jgi:hypothetical protein
MKIHLYHIKRVASVFMIFIILIEQSGCTATKIISTADIPISSVYKYKIYYRKTAYFLENTVISKDSLSGKIDINYIAKHAKNTVHIYPSSDSLVTVNTNMVISVPLSGISKIQLVEASPKNTTLFIIGMGTTLVILFIIGYIEYQNMFNGVGFLP